MTRRKTCIPLTTEGRSVSKGKVVLVPFPFDDLTATKVRPAVCLTDPVGPYRHIVLAFVTSRIPAAPTATDIVLDIRQPGMAVTGLRIPSTLMLHRLVTVSSSRVTRELGTVPPAVEKQIADGLRRLFDL